MSYTELQLTEAQLDNLTLIEIEKLLEANTKSLEDFPSMPFPNNYVTAQLGNRLIYDEKNYDTKQQKEEFQNLFKSLTGKHVMEAYYDISTYYYLTLSI
jgi:hypothetical protein